MSLSCSRAVCPTLEPVPGQLVETDPERWYAARGWPTRRDADPDSGPGPGPGSGPAAAAQLWLLTGGLFDVVEVSEPAGRRATRRLLEYRQAVLAPGPVGLTGPGRCGFLVAPGAREDLPELLEWLDWGGIELGIRAYGEGEQVRAPGPEDWLHDPSAPAPEVIALLATIAEACWLEGLARSAAPVRLAAPRDEPG